MLLVLREVHGSLRTMSGPGTKSTCAAQQPPSGIWKTSCAPLDHQFRKPCLCRPDWTKLWREDCPTTSAFDGLSIGRRLLRHRPAPDGFRACAEFTHPSRWTTGRKYADHRDPEDSARRTMSLAPRRDFGAASAGGLHPRSSKVEPRKERFDIIVALLTARGSG